MPEDIEELVLKLIRERLTLDTKVYRGYYDESDTVEISLMLDGHKISSVDISL